MKKNYVSSVNILYTQTSANIEKATFSSSCGGGGDCSRYCLLLLSNFFSLAPASIMTSHRTHSRRLSDARFLQTSAIASTTATQAKQQHATVTSYAQMRAGVYVFRCFVRSPVNRRRSKPRFRLSGNDNHITCAAKCGE